MMWPVRVRLMSWLRRSSRDRSRAHLALRAGTVLIVAIVLIAIPCNANPSLNGNLTLVMS